MSPSVLPAQLPIFPLNSVLFPDGILQLRVFEARYMDMVRDCLQQEKWFGVCLIRKGSEVGASADPEPVGCAAQIESWDMQQLGVLNIRTRGIQRFQILHSHLTDQQLRIAEVEWIEADPEQAVSATAAPCVNLLRRIVGDMEQKNRAANNEQLLAEQMPIHSPYAFDQVAWVANRLCEVLQIPLRAKQKLMELEDPAVRLQLVQQYLQQHKVI